MVTTTAPPPFLARLSAGTEDPRRLPPSLFQRLMRGDNNYENQPGCCLAGAGGSGRPALKRVRRRKGKIRPGPSGLVPSRYQQYQQHRAGLARRTPGPSEPRALPALDVPPALVEEPPTPAPARAAPSKPLRKELLKNKIGKSEKAPAPHCQSVHSTHPGEQPKSSKPKSKCNTPQTKSTSAQNNFWQFSVSPAINEKQEKKPLNNSENFRHVKSKKPGSPAEVNQKESYAGAKFSDPPSPSVLPKPPSHWVGCSVEGTDQNKELMAVHLKTLLKVQA